MEIILNVQQGMSFVFTVPSMVIQSDDHVFPYIILRSTGADGHRWKFTADDSGMLQQPGEDLGV